MGRAAQGVRILNIERPDTLIGMDTVAQEDDAEKRFNEEESKVVSISGELDLDGSDESPDVESLDLNDSDEIEESNDNSENDEEI